MIARYLPIALASLVLSTAFVFPALAHRGSGRDVDKTDVPTLTKAQGVPSSVGFGSRVKPDRIVLTKSGVTYDLYIETDRGLSFYGTFDRDGAAATADRLRLEGEVTVVCRSSAYPESLDVCPTNF